MVELIEGDKILGVPHFWFFMIILFLMILAELILGPDSTANGTVQTIIAFFTIGLAFLIGYFGWGILIFPSLVILSIAGYLLWNRLS